MGDRKATPDFGGYATKFGVVCEDGRTITRDAFKHQDGLRVPLVWQHQHDDPENVLGHAILSMRDDGVWADAYFNDNPRSRAARHLVHREDVNGLSILANRLRQNAKTVVHGMIRELSLVLAGANPGALIDNLTLAHGDGFEIVETDAIIFSGETLEHASSSDERPENNGRTAQDVYDDMDEEQRQLVHYMVGQAMEGNSSGSDDDDDRTVRHTADLMRRDPNKMTHSNIFERNGTKNGSGADDTHTLSHDAIRGIMADGIQRGSLKAAFREYALEHGINNLEILFPEAKQVGEIEFDKRRTEWVADVLNTTKKTPFANIKSIVADITQDAARAKGYIKGRFKKEEWFGLVRRTTGPTTVYKKQKLDRDDIIDITDLDIIAFMRGEMRLMFDEELARAVLISDGREVDDEDKIKDPIGATDGRGIRSILNDHELYAATVNIPVDGPEDTPSRIVDSIIEMMRFYKGSGSPNFYTTQPMLTTMLLAKDTTGRRFYHTAQELAAVLGVNRIIPVEPMEDIPELVGIIVNLRDYTIGTDRGGQVAWFEDFDIDFNQNKYLIEARMSGALTKIRSALIIKKADTNDTLVTPVEPRFDNETFTITPQTTEGVIYRRSDTNAVVRTDTPIVLNRGQTLKIFAVPAADHYFYNNIQDEWEFTRPLDV